MAGSQYSDDHPDESNFEDIFDFEAACAEDPARRERVCGAEPQAPEHLRLPDHRATFESRQEQDYPTKTRVEPSLERLLEPTVTGIEPQNEHEQLPQTNHQIEEVQNLDDELENIELRKLELRRNKLLRRRRTLLQESPLPQQGQTSERSGLQPIQDDIIANESISSRAARSESSNHPSQRGVSFPTAFTQIDNSCVSQFYNGTSKSSQIHPMDVPYPVDDQVNTVFAGSSLFVPALPDDTLTRSSTIGFTRQAEMQGVASDHISTQLSVLPALTGPSCNENLHQYFESDVPNTVDLGHPGFISQDDMIAAGPSSLDFIDSSNSTITGPFNSGVTNSGKVQDLVATPVLAETPMQVASAELPYGQSQNPTQSTSISHSLEQDLPSQNKGMAGMTRKRTRSSEPSQEHRLSIISKQLSKQTGVPECSLDTFCYKPQPKRQRTSTQKKNKKDVQNAGGSCVLCFITKKKCSGQRPCDHCRSYWEKRVYSSTSFMWTCDVWLKLTDFNIFNSPLEGIPDSELQPTFASQISGLSEFRTEYDYFRDLMENLEPLRIREYLYSVERRLSATTLYTYAHSIVRWKEAIIYMAPELGRFLAFFETLFRVSCLHVCKLCDAWYKSPRKDVALLWTALILDEARFLRHDPMLEPLLAERLISTLEGRLKVLCAQIFDFGPAQKSMQESKIQPLAVLLDSSEAMSLFLPPHYRGFSAYLRLAEWAEIPPTGTAVQWEAPPCLLSRANSNKSGYDASQTDHCCYNCCCGWMFDCLPSGLLSFFGQSALSFAHYFHAKERVFDAHDFMPALFGPTDIEEMNSQKEMAIVKLRKKRAIFRLALHNSLQCSFLVIHKLMQLSTTMKLSEDQLGVQAGIHRQAVLFLIIKTAVSTYAAFVEPDRKITGAGSVLGLIEFIDWQTKAPEAKQLREVLMDRIIQLGFLRLNLVAGMSRNDWSKSWLGDQGTEKTQMA